VGEIVGAAVLAHVPTIVLPDEERRALNNGHESTLHSGLFEVRDQLDALDIDLVVVFDTHWFTTVEFVVAAHERRAGLYTSEELPRGMSQVPYDIEGDPEFAQVLAAAGSKRDECWITAIDDPYLPIHYPTVNLLRFLQSAGQRWVSVSVAQTGDTQDFLTVGACVAEAVEQLDRRVFLIGSGALSHTFWPLRELRAHESAGEEHIFTPAAAAADHRVIELWAQGDHATVIDEMPEYRTYRPEGRFGHYLMIAGALGGRDLTWKGTAYSEYENAIGTGQIHMFFTPPPDGEV
jgi:3,4-dihydroxyphenylacetate 2,3-dioxygenase